jgi:short-subunit dehydrogenase
LSKALLPHFLERKSGHFVVITSLMGKFGAPMRSAYSAAKHGLHGFFETIRAESWRENVKVTLICPGYVRTNVSVNALTGDGHKQGTMDEATDQGMKPEDLAKKIAKAVRQEKLEAVYGGKETIAVYLKRFFPGILAKVLRTAKVT